MKTEANPRFFGTVCYPRLDRNDETHRHVPAMIRRPPAATAPRWRPGCPTQPHRPGSMDGGVAQGGGEGVAVAVDDLLVGGQRVRPCRPAVRVLAPQADRWTFTPTTWPRA